MAEDREKVPGEMSQTAADDARPEGEPQAELERSGAEGEPKASHGADRRGRLVVAGLIATATVSIVALGVAGIVQLTSRWLTTCPTDLPVNDPAPILWKSVTADQIKPTPLGVPEKVAGEARFKQQ